MTFFLDKKLTNPIQGLDLYPSPFVSPTIGTNGTCVPQVRDTIKLKLELAKCK